MTERPADTLNEIGVLKRREIEARILMPILEALGDEFGRDRVFEVARRVIVGVAQEQGRQLAERMGGNSLTHFAAALEDWKKGDRKSTRLNSSHSQISYAVFCLKKKIKLGSSVRYV